MCDASPPAASGMEDCCGYTYVSSAVSTFCQEGGASLAECSTMELLLVGMPRKHVMIVCSDSVFLCVVRASISRDSVVFFLLQLRTTTML
jgi:hypothetical protein